MSLSSSFIILIYFLTFDVYHCIKCDLAKSRKMFKDESGIEWECSVYCPEIRGCKDQCCPIDAEVKDNVKSEDKEMDKHIAEGHNSGQSQESPGKIMHVTISPATGAVIGVMVCIFVVAVVALSLKLNRIFTAAREQQQNADPEMQDTQSILSCYLAQASSDTNLQSKFNELPETVV